jgi:cobalamin synthase
MNNLKLAWFSFWYAMAFLTRIPAVNLSKALKSNHQKIAQGSLYFYPLVGLIIGFLMLVVYFVCAWQVGNSYPLPSSGFDSSSLVIAAMMLVMWCLVTGGLHLGWWWWFYY